MTVLAWGRTMPLVIVCGLPCSGKTTFSKALKAHIEEHYSAYKTCLINEETLSLSKAKSYLDANEEKKSRAAFISAIERSISKDTVVIADSLNYIKGLRYQLYCIARAASTPHCAVHVLSSDAECRKINQDTNTYPTDAFEELLERFETPNNMTKWDSPLFAVAPLRQILPEELEEICKSICADKAKKPPTFATSSRGAGSGDLIAALDKITQETCDSLLSQLKPFGPSTVRLQGCEEELYFSKPVSAGTLSSLRRQFIHMNRLRPMETSNIAALFVNYIMSAI